MIKSKFIIVLLVLTVYGCDIQSKPEKTTPVQTGDNKITDLLITKLKENSDWYRIVDESTIEIKYPPPSYVIDYVNQETNKIIPRGRSMALSADLQPEILKELKSKNISYNLVLFGGEEWLVWDEKNNDKVNNVIQSVAIKALNVR